MQCLHCTLQSCWVDISSPLGVSWLRCQAKHVNIPARAAGSQRPRLQLRLERVQCRGTARCAWRLWLSPQKPPLLLLLYRTNLKVEGVTQVQTWQLFVVAVCMSCKLPELFQHRLWCTCSCAAEAHG